MAARDLPDIQQAFEELVVPEGFRAELIDGEIILSPSGTRLHWRLLRTLADQFAGVDRWECITEQTIRHPRFLHLPEPDLAVLPYSDDPAQDADYHPADQVLFVAEVISRTNPRNDEVRKVGLYASFGIPVYLIIDPFKGRCSLYSAPTGDVYTECRVTAFGDPIEVPAPLNLDLETGAFRTYRT